MPCWNGRRSPPPTLLNEVPEHMAQEFQLVRVGALCPHGSSMKFLSTWLRNFTGFWRFDMLDDVLNEVPEHMAQEYWTQTGGNGWMVLLNEVPEHMAQEWDGEQDQPPRVTPQ